MTGIGAAFCAGLGAGLWTDQQEIKDLVKVERIFTPQITAAHRAELDANWQKAVTRSKN